MKLKSVVAAAIILAVTVSACSKGKEKFSLASSGIQAGGLIPQTNAYTACGGENFSPELSWSNPPAGTKSFAITLIDRNASGWIHWIAYNIPATVTSLAQNGPLPAGAVSVVNSFGSAGYGGPCPPAGSSHTYEFRIWALDVRNASEIDGFTVTGNDDFIENLGNHAIDTAKFDVKYQR